MKGTIEEVPGRGMDGGRDEASRVVNRYHWYTL